MIIQDMKLEGRKSLQTGTTSIFPTANLLNGEWRRNFSKAFDKATKTAGEIDRPVKFTMPSQSFEASASSEAAQAAEAARRLNDVKDLSGSPLADPNIEKVYRESLAGAKGEHARPTTYDPIFQRIQQSARFAPTLGVAYNEAFVPDPAKSIGSVDPRPGIVASAASGHLGNILAYALRNNPHWLAQAAGAAANWGLPVAAGYATTASQPVTFDVPYGPLAPDMRVAARLSDVRSGRMSEGDFREMMSSRSDPAAAYRKDDTPWWMSRANLNNLTASELGASFALLPSAHPAVPLAMAGMSAVSAAARPFVERWQTAKRNQGTELGEMAAATPIDSHAVIRGATTAASPLLASIGTSRLLGPAAPGLRAAAGRAGLLGLAANAASSAGEFWRAASAPEKDLLREVRTDILRDDIGTAGRLARGLYRTFSGDPVGAAGITAPVFDPEIRHRAEQDAYMERVGSVVHPTTGEAVTVDLNKLDDTQRSIFSDVRGMSPNALGDFVRRAYGTIEGLQKAQSYADRSKSNVSAALYASDDKQVPDAVDRIAQLSAESGLPLSADGRRDIARLVTRLGSEAVTAAMFPSDPAERQRAVKDFIRSDWLDKGIAPSVRQAVDLVDRRDAALARIKELEPSSSRPDVALGIAQLRQFVDNVNISLGINQ